jgi:hypothetical protein
MNSVRGPVPQLLLGQKLAGTRGGEPVLAIVERRYAQALLAQLALSNVGQWGL